jgi:stringent starvation protein A
MSSSPRRKSSMQLFASPDSCWSHRVRLVIAEKNIAVDVIDVDPHQPPEDLLDLNPYGSVPTLVDRDLVLYDSRVIMEYLDERFPHPPLLPSDPVNRARFRLALARVEQDWYGLLESLESDRDLADPARRTLAEGLAASAEVFAAKPFFLSDEPSLVDCSLGPLLWRLPCYAIELPVQARAVVRYAERLFSRPAFQLSLSRREREMRY